VLPPAPPKAAELDEAPNAGASGIAAAVDVLKPSPTPVGGSGLAAHGASVVAVALIVTVIPAIGTLALGENENEPASGWVYQPAAGIVALGLSHAMRLAGKG
jgi:hypothetical protein